MKKILVIDDDTQVRKVIDALLSRQGFDIIQTDDGRSATRLVATEKPDLVITDILMPNKDGLETISDLKSMQPELKIVAMSGGGTFLNPRPYLDMASMLGADVVLSKPVGLQTLLQTVHQLFDAELVGYTLPPA